MIKSSYKKSYSNSRQKAPFDIVEVMKKSSFHKLLWASCFILVIAYIFFITSAIRQGIATSKIESSITSISSELLKLEYSYLSLANKIDLREAYSRGFVESKNPLFVDAVPVPSLSLSR